MGGHEEAPFPRVNITVSIKIGTQPSHFQLPNRYPTHHVYIPDYTILYAQATSHLDTDMTYIYNVLDIR